MGLHLFALTEWLSMDILTRKTVMPYLDAEVVILYLHCYSVR